MGRGGEDVAPPCVVWAARRRDTRNGPARLLRVSPAAPVLGRLGAEEVNEGRTLPSVCGTAILEARRPNMRSGPVRLFSLDRLCRPEPPESRGGHGREDVASSVCGGHHRARGRVVATGPQLQWPRRGKQTHVREGVLFTAGLAAVGRFSRGPRIRKHRHNVWLAAFRPDQKKTAEPRRRVLPSAQEALNAWRSCCLDLIVAGLRSSSSSSRRQVVVAFLDTVVGLRSSSSPYVSSSLCRLV